MDQERFQSILREMTEDDREARQIWESTPDLAKANLLASDPGTRAEGIALLVKLADRFPESKNVCALVAQALAWDGRQDEAVAFIKIRFPDVIGGPLPRREVEAVFKAVATGSRARLEKLIGSNPSLVNARSDEDMMSVARGPGRTPLHLASARDKAELAGVLIRAGAALNARERYGCTPLHFAASQGHKAVAQVLIEAGADLEIRGKMIGGWTALRYAAANGHTALVELLIERGADVNARDAHGDMPLHSAASEGHKDIVQLLIGRGADLSAEGSYGSPLQRATEKGHKEVAAMLRVALGK